MPPSASAAPIGAGKAAAAEEPHVSAEEVSAAAEAVEAEAAVADEVRGVSMRGMALRVSAFQPGRGAEDGAALEEERVEHPQSPEGQSVAQEELRAAAPLTVRSLALSLRSLIIVKGG